MLGPVWREFALLPVGPMGPAQPWARSAHLAWLAGKVSCSPVPKVELLGLEGTLTLVQHSSFWVICPQLTC